MTDGIQNPNAQSAPRLSDADAYVLDALLEARAEGAVGRPMPPGSAERIERMTRLLALLDRDPVEPAPDDLTQRTLEFIQAQQQRARFAQQIEMLREPRRTIGVNWRQFAAAAAIFVVGLSLLFPALDKTRADARRLACAGNLATAGSAFQSYAADFAGVLPRGNVRPGDVWWNVGETDEDGQTRSNTSHLYRLVRAGYASPEQLACAGNPKAVTRELTSRHQDWPDADAVSYSYQNQYTPRPIRLERVHRLAILSDKNPLFVVRRGRVTFDASTPATAPSRIHGSRGQNILLNDGSVRWTITPMIVRSPNRTDNVWSVPGVAMYTGKEAPALVDGDVDSFLVP